MLQLRRALLLPALIASVVVDGCNCDEVVGLQAPEAILVFRDQNAPPLENLTVGVGAIAIGQSGAARFTVENRGNIGLQVSDIVLTTHPLCPVVSGAFSIAQPQSVGGAARAITVDRGGSAEVVVNFTPTSGQPACAVVEVKSNDTANPSLFALLTGQGDAPQLCASRGVVDFGTLTVGDRREETVTLTSCGTRAVTLEATTLNAQFPEPFEVVTAITTPQTLQPGAGVDVVVAFAPDAPGTFASGSNTSGILDIDTDLADLYRVEYVGVATLPPACRIQVVPSQVQFGSVGEGRTSTQTVFVRNIGELDCTFTSADVTVGADVFSRVLAADFPGGSVLGPTQAGSLTVTYAPTVADGVDDGVLAVVTNDPVNPTLNVPLQGTSVELTPCFLEASPTSVEFGFRTLGRTTERAVTLTNVGTETCMVTEITPNARPEFNVIQSAFSQIDVPIFGDFFGALVPAGDSTEFIVTFSPTQVGQRSGTVEVEYKEVGFGNPDQSLVVPVNGRVEPACIRVDPLTLDFGTVAQGSTRDLPAQVSNCGPADLVIRGTTLRSGTHPDFRIQSPTTTTTLAPGAATTVTVRAAPTAQGTTLAGAQMFGTLDVLSEAGTLAVALTANTNGACQNGLVCTPRTVDFGDVLVGEDLVRSVICNNPSNTPVTINPTVAAPFAVVSAPAQIAAGGQGVIRVRYDATTTTPASQTLNLGANDCSGAPIAVNVRGRGADDELPVCPAPQAFTPEQVWDWNGSTVDELPGSHEVWVTPLVSRLEDTNGDGSVTRDDLPRVVIISFDRADSSASVVGGIGGGDQSSINDPIPSNLRALDGPTGNEVWTVTDEALAVQSASTPAIIDLDGDGRVEIIANKYLLLPGVEDIPGGPKVNGKFARGSLLVFNFDGTLKFETDEWTRRSNELEDGGAPAVGDVDGDGFAEIALGDHLYDHNGRLLWRGDGSKIGSTGHGPTSVLVDVDGQPGLELVAGTRVFRKDGTILWDRADLEDGHPAVGDLDGDGDNEVVIRGSELHVLDGATGASLTNPHKPPSQLGMPFECETPNPLPEGEDDPCSIIPTNPAIIDFDGDGTREIINASKELITAYHFTGTALQEVFRNGFGDPIFDGSGASGPAGFDFNGAGGQEIVYADEGSLKVWTSPDALIYDTNHGSATIFEYSTIADLDLDGHADMLTVSNSFLLAANFGGVKRVRNQGVSWAQARPTWNQHAYVESLVSELGTPLFQAAPQALPGYRTTSSRCE